MVLACGGSAGHVIPALAVAEAWADVEPEVDVLVVGSTTGLEAHLVSRTGCRFQTVRAAPFFGVSGWERVRAVRDVLGGVRDARRLLRDEGAQLVVGFGGYAAVPCVAAAAWLRIPALVHEANAALGAANWLLAPLADQLLLGVAGATGLRTRATTVVGVPVRATVLAVARAERRPPDPSRPLRLLVAGGSYGSEFLNARAPALAARLAARGHRVEVRHLVGRGSAERVRDAYRACGVPAHVDPFLDDVAAAYAWADAGVVSAGAVTLAEVGVAGLPVLVVPQANVARGHQLANARSFAASTGAPWVEEGAWDDARVAHEVATRLFAADAWREAVTRLRRTACPDAARRVVEIGSAVLTRRRGRAAATGP